MYRTFDEDLVIGDVALAAAIDAEEAITEWELDAFDDDMEVAADFADIDDADDLPVFDDEADFSTGFGEAARAHARRAAGR